MNSVVWKSARLQTILFSTLLFASALFGGFHTWQGMASAMPKDKDSALTARLEAAPSRFALAASSVSDSSLEGALQSQFVGKIFTLRGFYDDDHLHYDGKGHLLGLVHPGSWTTSLILVRHEKVSESAVELSGPRFAQRYDSKQRKFVPVRTNGEIIILFDRNSAQSNDDVVSAIQSIFLGSKDRLIDLVPDYWKAIVSRSVETIPQESGPDCYRIKGDVSRKSNGEIVIPCEEHAKVKSSNGDSVNVTDATLPYSFEKKEPGTAAPRPVKDPPPEYSAFARSLKVGGTVLLRATVNPDGSVSEVSVTEPLGFGLDDEVAATVRTWRFKPALLKGVPVPVRIDVQVNYHGY